jgi:hypothetical protein
MKKVLSLVLVIAMVLSSMSFAFASTFTDIADTDYTEAIETLEALGVITGYEDGTYRPEKTVTRAEMAKLMVQLLGYGDLVAGSKSNFTDTQGHWADQWIALAAGRGIVIGTGDGKFNPDGIVTYDQVLTMLVRGLGYTDTSNEMKNMTWPTNFKVKAAELNITKNVDMKTADADRGGVAQAMFNSLEQQLVKVNSDGDIVREYVSTAKDDKTPVKLISRIATADYEFEVGFQHIDPADKNYAGDKVDLTQYLFQSVEAYFNKNKDKEVVYVGKVNSITYSDEFDSEDLANNELVVGDYTFNVKTALVSYNNVEAKLSDLKKDNLEDAKITVVLDKDETRVKDSAKAEGIIVEKATSYVQIEEAYKADATTIDEIYLPVKDKKVDSKNLIVKGDATELSDIEEDDIVAVYAPLGKDATVKATDKLTLAVSRKTVEGKVTGTHADGIYVDKTKYDVNEGLSIDVPDLGDEGTFYLDDNGKIIAFKGESEGDKTYAVVADVFKGTFEKSTAGKYSVDKAPRVKLHTSSNETVTYTFDITLDKTGVIENKKLKDLFSVDEAKGEITLKAGVKLVDELVSYSLDSKTKDVSSIEVISRAIDMKTNSKSFILASNAVIFNKDGDVISESKLGSEVKGVAAYKNGKIVALYATSVVEKTTPYYAYINSVYKDLDNDDNKVQRVNAYINGVKKDIFTSEEDLVTSTKGLYILELNDDDVIQKDAIALDPAVGASGKYVHADIANAVTASAVSASEGTITINKTTQLNFNIGSGTIIKIDKDDDIEVVSKLSAIKADDTKFVYFLDKTSNLVEFIIIFE